MTEPPDDELRAMLEARADRVPATASREVMAAVREEVRGPRGGAGFAVLPVLSGARGSKAPAGWAAIGVVAVLVLAVMGGKLGPGPAQPSAGTASGGPSASSRAASATTPSATQVVASPGIPTVTMEQLRTGLAAGTLEGRTVLVTDRLRTLAWPCPFPVPDDCYGLELVGLEGIVVTHAGLMTRDEARARIDGDQANRPMAFRVTGGQLALLGWITQGAETPLTVHGLLTLDPAPSRGEVALVAGWLIPSRPAPPCPTRGESTTPCVSGPMLSDAPPMLDGTEIYAQGIRVGLDPAVAFGSDGAALAGPFLVRHRVYLGGDLPPYEIAAVLDPATTVRVGPGSSSLAMTPEQLGAAVADGSMDGRLIAITGWLQPSGGLCPADLPQPCAPYAILGLDVRVTWDGTMPFITLERPLPLSTTAATLVVTPRDGRLVLLGRLPGDLERPSSLQELTGSQHVPLRDQFALMAVSGWLVVGGIHSCPALGPDATPCPGPPPAITDKEPSPDGLMNSDLQVPVAVGASVPGIEPAHVVTKGPFLVRILHAPDCPRTKTVDLTACLSVLPPSLQVAARYDVATVYRVVLP